jgi:hypothetical protein
MSRVLSSVFSVSAKGGEHLDDARSGTNWAQGLARLYLSQLPVTLRKEAT